MQNAFKIILLTLPKTSGDFPLMPRDTCVETFQKYLFLKDGAIDLQ
jgi:hypothetical protein